MTAPAAGEPPGAAANTAWAIALIDRLAEHGLRHAVISPGSRGTPLVLAADAHPDIATTVHIDERGAAFFAVGVARATQRPVAVITTSGTAVANLLPACAEAHNDNVPLVLLTADRPPRLRGSGANQTMDQVGVLSHFVRFEVDLQVPDPGQRAAMIGHVDEAMRQATAWPPGPVHLNQPFDKPLEPDATGRDAIVALRRQAPRRSPLRQPATPNGPVPDIDLQHLGPRGLIVCGPGTGAHLADRIVALGRRLGAPVAADALSGLRFGHETISAYDLFAGAPGPHGEKLDFVIQFGRTPTSNALRRYLAKQSCPRYRLDHSGRGWDDIGDVTFVTADPARWLDRLIETVPGAVDVGWTKKWRDLDEHARRIAARALQADPDVEAAWVPHVVKHARRLFVGNSLPVRDLDRFAAADHTIDVAANRGVSGIDGTIATAAGWAVGGRQQQLGAKRLDAVVAVIGDVAFQHDLGSLPLIPEHMRLVVIRNGGGRIFQHLPVNEATQGLGRDGTGTFDRLFLTPPQVDIEKACAAFGLDAVARPPSGLAEALRQEAQIIVVETDGVASAQWRQRVEQQVHQETARIVARP